MKNKLLSSAAILIITLIFFSSQSSCKKETVTNTVTNRDTVYQCTSTIKGSWVGTYTANSTPSQGQLFYSLTVFADGSLLYKAKGGDGNFYYARGSWTLSSNNIFSGNVVSFSTPTVTQSITATFSPTGTLSNGTWADISGGTNSGSLQGMVKIY